MSGTARLTGTASYRAASTVVAITGPAAGPRAPGRSGRRRASTGRAGVGLSGRSGGAGRASGTATASRRRGALRSSIGVAIHPASVGVTRANRVRTRRWPSRRSGRAIVRRNPGGVLLSQGASPQVPSALASLTAVFGMGTGVSPPPWPPETVRSVRGVRRQCGGSSSGTSRSGLPLPLSVPERARAKSQALGRLVPVG